MKIETRTPTGKWSKEKVYTMPENPFVLGTAGGRDADRWARVVFEDVALTLTQFEFERFKSLFEPRPKLSDVTRGGTYDLDPRGRFKPEGQP